MPELEGDQTTRLVAQDQQRLMGGQLQDPPDLNALAFESEVLLVLHREGRPLSNVEYSLYRQGERLEDLIEFDRGTTDSDGVLVFERRETGATEDSIWLDVKEAGRSHWLPFTSSGSHQDISRSVRNKDRWDWVDLREGEFIIWGWTDRMLYQPGDEVGFRLYIRERQANRLVVPENLDGFEIISGRSTTWLSRASQMNVTDVDWNLEFGSVAGSFMLPAESLDGSYSVWMEVDADDPRDVLSAGGRARFRVGAFSAQDVWLETEILAEELTAFEPIPISAKAGFFSGGPFVGETIGLEAHIEPTSPSEFYPQWNEFEFLQIWPEYTGQSIDLSEREGVPQTDADGQIVYEMAWVEDDQHSEWPFMSATVYGSVRSAGVSYGLDGSQPVPILTGKSMSGFKLDREPLRPWQIESIQMVAINSDGTEIADWTGRIEIYREQDDHPEIVFSCDARQAQPSCSLPMIAHGIYTVIAAAEESEPAERTMWLGRGERQKEPELRINLIDQQPVAGQPFRLQIDQPFQQASALLTIEHGRLLHHESITIDRPQQELTLMIEPEWQPGFTLGALLLPGPGEDDKMPLADAIRVEMAEQPVPPPFEVEFEDEIYSPGDEVQIVVESRSPHPQEITIAVIEDSLVQMTPELYGQRDPFSSDFLELLDV
ncbi:MAG: hypothetical protein AAGJ52_14445, partial [Pseudomonadota bacterium]